MARNEKGMKYKVDVRSNEISFAQPLPRINPSTSAIEDQVCAMCYSYSPRSFPGNAHTTLMIAAAY